MRIVSLLPSLTELICALGRHDDLVGVTHECDFPPGVEALPHLTRSRIPEGADSATIDALVSAQVGSLYDLDHELLERLRPDLVLTQSQCDVCAVNETVVRECASRLPGSPRVESVNPLDLAGVHAMFRRVGDLVGARAEAEALVEGFEATAEEIAGRLGGRPRSRTVLLEWFDPLFSSGHWNPEIVALAGGVEVLAQAREPSRRVSWNDLERCDPEVIVLAPCGFTLERSKQELSALFTRPEWPRLRAVRTNNVVMADGSAYFARPGPRLEASLKIAAAAIAPDVCGDLAPATGWARLGPGMPSGVAKPSV
jgi:iron complex transport system substrate-binding protein